MKEENNATKKQSQANAAVKQPSAQDAESDRIFRHLRITAKCGTVVRTLTFPITHEMEDWMWELDSLYGDPTTLPHETFELEGNGKMKLSLSILSFERKF